MQRMLEQMQQVQQPLAVSAHNKDTAAHTDMQNRINANTNNLSTLSGTVSTHTGNENIHLSDDDRNKLNTAYDYGNSASCQVKLLQM